MLDLGDLQLRDMLILSGDAEILYDLIGLFCESLVDGDGVFGVCLGQLKVVAYAWVSEAR